MESDALFNVMLEFAPQVIGGEGVSRASSPKGETYVYRTAELEIVGVLRVLSSGIFVIAVRSDSRRKGIATALLKAASERKPIDFSKSTYSQDGQALVDASPKWELTKTQGRGPI